MRETKSYIGWSGLIIISGFILLGLTVNGQEKVCLPNTLRAYKVTGTIYLNNGDSISGVFSNLTDVNDILTTHILVDTAGVDFLIPRTHINSYFDSDDKERKYKIYHLSASLIIKKQCRYDIGIFVKEIVDGPYKLLIDKLKAESTIQAYNQSTTDDVYYLVTPANKLIKIILNDLKPQLRSIFIKYPGTDRYFSDPEFNIESAAELIRMVNSSILRE
jgi:hypothetical protein